MEGRKVPKIRFRGVADEWEQRKFAEIVTFFNGLTYTPGDVREIGTFVLRSSNVSDGKIVDADNIYVNPEVVNCENVKPGDIVIVVRNGSRSLIGKHAEIKSFMPNTVIGAFMTGIRSQYPSFVNALLSTPQFEKEIEMNMGATINQITGYMFSKMKFFVPSDVEKEIIGECFRQIDNILALYQSKVEKLKLFKEAMLDKMFPKNGQKVPEIRFKGFTDDWEQHRLGEEVTDMIAGGDIDKNLILEKGRYPVIANALTNEGIVGYYDFTYRIKAPAVTVTGRGDVGHAKARSMDFTPVVRLLTIKSKHDIFFMENSINILRIVVESTGVPQLTVPQLAKYELYFPKTLNEEKVIGKYFHNLDNLITLHQRKYEKLKLFKEAMLNKMFI